MMTQGKSPAKGRESAIAHGDGFFQRTRQHERALMRAVTMRQYKGFRSIVTLQYTRWDAPTHDAPKKRRTLQRRSRLDPRDAALGKVSLNILQQGTTDSLP